MAEPINQPIAPPLNPAEQAVGEALRRYVEALAGGIGIRHDTRPGSIDQAIAYLRGELGRLGQSPSNEAYDTPAGTATNLIVEWTGESKPDEIVLLGAHYDTFHQTPGADDNASAVAMLLVVLDALRTRRFGRTLRFVLFANEEPPHSGTGTMGSVVHASRCKEGDDNLYLMVCLEMVGYFTTAPNSQSYPDQMPTLLKPLLRTTGDFIGFVSDLKTRPRLKRFAKAFKQAVDFPAIAAPLPYARKTMWVSDHGPFWDRGYPALMVTDTSYYRNDHYHQATDTPDTLDYDRMARVAVGVTEAVAAMAGPIT